MVQPSGAPRGAGCRCGAPCRCGDALAARYAGVVLDIDGVVRRGPEPIPGAGDAVARLRDRGVAVAFVTNNASRTPGEMAAALREVGVAADAGEIVTSAQAAAALLDPGTRCLVIGMTGLQAALAERDCVLVESPDAAEAVVVGFDRNLVWDDLRRATLAIRRGARFVATNADRTFPSPEGLWPGNGAIVAALETATDVTAEVAGKPQPPLLLAAAERLPDGPLLMVGDRPDTDLDGAAALGWDTALVLTGVTPRDAVAGLARAPTWVLDSVADLLAPPQLFDGP